MLFSQVYRLKRRGHLRWFDPVLFRDTNLFIDPFLIYRSEAEYFKGAHEELIAFFDRAFELGAECRGDRSHPGYEKLTRMLRFPEPQEVCLGYAAVGTAGSGMGGAFSKNMVKAVLKSIKAGIRHFDHFEQLDLVSEGVGCDRISDMTTSILKHRFVKFTQAVCKELGVPIEQCAVRYLRFNMDALRWENGTAMLPRNPFHDRGVILVPERFLRRLPVISKEEFCDYIWSNMNRELRNDFNYDVKTRINKHRILEIAASRPEWVSEYLGAVERQPASHYDLVQDRDGVYKWAPEAAKFASHSRLQLDATDHEEFESAVSKLVTAYKRFVEKKGGYRLLWNDSPRKPRSELSAQLLFMAMALSYCHANNIDLNREVSTGLGLLDFKFSRGYRERVILEVKLARNPGLQHGIEVQLPHYLDAEDVKDGYYLVVFHDEDELKAIRSVTRIARDMTKGHALRLKVVKVDATIDKPSASRARRGPESFGDMGLRDMDSESVSLGSNWDTL